LGHLRYSLKDVRPQSNSPPDNVLGGGLLYRVQHWLEKGLRRDVPSYRVSRERVKVGVFHGRSEDLPLMLHLLHLTTGSGSATVFDGAFARCHGSRLFTLRLHFSSQSSGVVFNIAGAWKFFTRLAWPCVFFPNWTLILSRLSASFFWLIAFFTRDRQSHPSVLIHSSNLPPFR